MRRVFLIVYIVLSLLIGVQSSFALDYSRISTNEKIVSALTALDEIHRRDVIAILYGQNATKQPIRVMFRDLAMYGYKDCEALTVPTKNKGLVISQFKIERVTEGESN